MNARMLASIITLHATAGAFESGLDRWFGVGRSRPARAIRAWGWRPVDADLVCPRCGRVVDARADRNERAGPPCDDDARCRPIGDLMTCLGPDAPPLSWWVRAAKGPDPWWEMSATLGHHLGIRARDVLGIRPGAWVVPVPSAGPPPVLARLMGRPPREHTLVLAASVARATRGSLRRGVLQNRSGTRMAGLGRHERLSDATDAIRPGRRAIPDGITVLLVDDVRTTGTTLRRCVEQVRSMGAGDVLCAVVATRDRPRLR